MSAARCSLRASVQDEPLPEPWIDRRRFVRQTTVLQVAKLIIGRFEELCVIRDVSAGGLKAEVYCPVPTGLAAIVELRTGYRAAGRIAWSDETMVGLEFDQNVSASNLLIHCSLDERIGRVRPARLAACIPGRLAIEGEICPVELRDVSLAGMKVRVARQLVPDTDCTIAPEAMEPRPALVRWYRDGKAGIQLVEPLQFDEFAAWRCALADQPRRLWVLG